MSCSPTPGYSNTNAETLALQFEDKQLKCNSCCLSLSLRACVSVGGCVGGLVQHFMLCICGCEASSGSSAQPKHTRLRAKNFN